MPAILKIAGIFVSNACVKLNQQLLQQILDQSDDKVNVATD